MESHNQEVGLLEEFPVDRLCSCQGLRNIGKKHFPFPPSTDEHGFGPQDHQSVQIIEKENVKL